MRFKAVVPAAGVGKRFRPLTLWTPKVMLEVAGKPVIGHIMDRLLKSQPDEVIVVIGPHDRKTRRYLQSAYNYPFRFVIQRRPLGLAHAVYQTKRLFRGEPVLILLGDTILETDFRRIISGQGSLGVQPVSDPRRFGVVELKGRVITRIVEKPQRPKSNLAIVGIYYLADSALLFERLTQLIRSGHKERGEYPFTETLEELALAGVQIRPVRIERWLDCGTVAAILETNRFLLRRNCHFRPRKGCIIIPPVFIDDSARVESSIIGPNVSLGPDVTVRESIVRDAIVNSGAVLERMVVARAVVGPGRPGKTVIAQS